MATISERKNKEGQLIGWQVRVRRRGHPIQVKTFERKTDADRWARRVEREMDDGMFVNQAMAHQTTLADLIDMYIKEVTPGHKGAVQERIRLEQLKRFRLSQYAAATVKNKDFADWRNERLEEVSAGTVIRELNLWHAIIEHGRKEWGINLPENPVHLVKRPKADPARERRLEPTDGEGMTEEHWLLAACDADKDPWMGAIVRLAIETGMRQGEILGLKWDDLDKRKPVVYVRRGGQSDEAVRQGTKNGDTVRAVLLSSRAVNILKDLPRSLGGLVFPIDQNAFKMRFRRCVDRAGLGGLRFHDLRHEATSRFFEQGLDMMEVASITGHKTLAMLKRYTHLHAPTLAKKLG
jgi:integrase